MMTMIGIERMRAEIRAMPATKELVNAREVTKVLAVNLRAAYVEA